MSAEHDRAEIQRANESGLVPVVLVHGLWLLASSWARWGELFAEAGYAPVALSWPGDPDSVEEANAHPEAFADQTVGRVADHLEALVDRLVRTPAVIGHSFGGMLAQILAGRGLSAATVAICPAPLRGVLPLQLSAYRSVAPVLVRPGNRRRGVALTERQFRYAFTNAVSEEEAARLYREFAVPGPGAPLFQLVTANLDPRTELRAAARGPARGPLLVISGTRDHVVPPSMCTASYRHQQHDPDVTELAAAPGRGHSLTIDDGWREVAGTALAFVRRFT